MSKAKFRPAVVDYFKLTKKEETDISALKAWVESFGDKFDDHFSVFSVSRASRHHDIMISESEQYVSCPSIIIRSKDLSSYYHGFSKKEFDILFKPL